MTELDMPSIGSATKKSPENEQVASSLQQANEKSKDIAEEALRKAALELTQDISDSAKQDKPSFGKAMKTWLTTQISHISQAVIALMIAAIVALVTPLLVKLELTDELQALSHNLSTQLDNRNAQNVLTSSLEISDTKTQLTQQTEDIRATISDLKETLALNNATVAESLQQQERRVTQLNDQYSKTLDALNKTQITQQRESAKSTTAVIYPPQLTPTLNRYISDGKRLLTQESINKQDVDEWIGEVYFFISLMPANQNNLARIQSSLNKIYGSEKPFDEEIDRINHTLVILNALIKWTTL
ncbi:MAG: hypothetical protein K6L80_06730 [Agarilytica sp.]